MNAIQDALADADYIRLQKLEHTRAEDFHKRLAEHPQRDAIFDALADITEIVALDDLRMVAAGYGPRPWQEVLSAYSIIPDTAVAAVTKAYQEARH